MVVKRRVTLCFCFIVLIEPPKWDIEPKDQLNVIGANVVIKCAASGNPKPDVKWMVNGRPLGGAPTFVFVLQNTVTVHASILL